MFLLCALTCLPNIDISLDHQSSASFFTPLNYLLWGLFFSFIHFFFNIWVLFGFFGIPKNNFCVFLYVAQLVDNHSKIVDERGRSLMCDRRLPSLLVYFKTKHHLTINLLYVWNGASKISAYSYNYGCLPGFTYSWSNNFSLFFICPKQKKVFRSVCFLKVFKFFYDRVKDSNTDNQKMVWVTGLEFDPWKDHAIPKWAW